MELLPILHMDNRVLTPWRRILQVVVGCIILATHTCTGETAFTFCDNAQPTSDNTIAMTFGGGADGQSQCTCSITATSSPTFLTFQLKVNTLTGTSLGPVTQGGQNKTLVCEPFASIRWARSGQLEQCAGQSDSAVEEASKFLLMPEEDDVTVTLHNHHRRPLEAEVIVTVNSGHVSVQCYPVENSDLWLVNTCPCDEAMVVPPGGFPDIFNRRDVGSSKLGLVVGLVSVAIFICVLVILGLLWWWRKKKGGSGEKDLERVTMGNATDNAAFSPSTTASRASGMDKAVTSDPHYANVPGHKGNSNPIPFEADPELDLSLRTPHGKGSKDSGMYSMPSDKTPNNNYHHYANAPLGPDQMYNPMLAKQPSVASLTGQGALQGSVDHLNTQNAVYAKPTRKADRKPGPPQRSASQDALNTNPPPRGDLAQARSRSHNASKSSMASVGSAVETDV